MEKALRALCLGGKIRRKSVANIAIRCVSTIVEPPSEEPPIPQYEDRHNEDTAVKRARLLYQSRKRGMLENGLLLSTFAAKHLDSLTEDQLIRYDSLINKPSNDWEIYHWATGAKPVPEEYNTDIMKLLKAHVMNEDRTVRLQQPSLYS
ncbi:hypothetical protein ScPMuIL_015779 [Solemya velum]